jgi:hypothetical protein
MECIAAHRVIVTDVIAVITIQHAARIIARPDFLLHAITVIDLLMHHGTRRDSIIDSQSHPVNMPEIRAAHVTPILVTSAPSHV